MIRVVESAVIDQPIGKLWSLLRDFNGHDRWHPLVTHSVISNGIATDQVGVIRDFTLTSGERVCERLLKLSDQKHSFSYTITDSDIPIANYVAHVELKPVTDSNATFWRWTSSFESPIGQEQKFKQLVANGVYRSGFDGARTFLRSQGGSVTESVIPAVDSATQKSQGIEGTAMSVNRHGDASVFSEIKTVAPAPAAGEVRLRQDAIGLNYIDVYTRTGYFDLIKPPAIPGMEAAGIVVDCGQGVTHLKPGDRVAYACAPPGAYASVRTFNADLVMPLPEHISNHTAAASMLKGITAWFLLNRVHQLQSHETVLVYAPAGGVGQMLVQWASSSGATVIGATSSPQKVATARLAGARHVIVPGPRSLEDQVKELTDGVGADVVFDAVGKDSFDHSVAALRPGGHLVSFGQASGDIGQRNIGAFAANSLKLSRPSFGHYTDTQEKVSEAANALWEAIRLGKINVKIAQTFELSDAANAHRQLEAKQTTGSSLLLAPGTTATTP